MVDLHLFLGLPLRDSFHRTPNSSTPSRNLGGSSYRHCSGTISSTTDADADVDTGVGTTEKAEEKEDCTLTKQHQQQQLLRRRQRPPRHYEGYEVESMRAGMVHFGGLPQPLLDAEAESVASLVAGDASGAVRSILITHFACPHRKPHQPIRPK